jgi:hypothetical protein
VIRPPSCTAWNRANMAPQKYYAVFAESKAAYESSKQSAYGHT